MRVCEQAAGEEAGVIKVGLALAVLAGSLSLLFSDWHGRVLSYL